MKSELALFISSYNAHRPHSRSATATPDEIYHQRRPSRRFRSVPPLLDSRPQDSLENYTNLLLLAPDLQEQLLQMNLAATGRDASSERRLRALLGNPDWRRQRAALSQPD